MLMVKGCGYVMLTHRLFKDLVAVGPAEERCACRNPAISCYNDVIVFIDISGGKEDLGWQGSNCPCVIPSHPQHSTDFCG